MIELLWVAGQNSMPDFSIISMATLSLIRSPFKWPFDTWRHFCLLVNFLCLTRFCVKCKWCFFFGFFVFTDLECWKFASATILFIAFFVPSSYPLKVDDCLSDSLFVCDLDTESDFYLADQILRTISLRSLWESRRPCMSTAVRP